MRKYLAFFKVRFFSGLQYRGASVSAVTTQMVWGLMECLAYRALHESNSAAFPMEYDAIVSYIWLKESCLMLFSTWNMDNDIVDQIANGGIAYELCRPVSLYKMWFSRLIGGRLATTVLKCVPVLTIAFLMPEPFKMNLPASPQAFFLFLLTMALGLGVTAAFCLLVYVLTFFTISPYGWRTLLMATLELLTGQIVPIPFMPESVRRAVELLPFAAMSNVPFRVYSGDLAGGEMWAAIGLQIFWMWALILAGKALSRKAVRQVVIQGG